MGRHFTNAVRELWRTFAELFNPYHPELHYMRGPGPKWHAKRPGSCRPPAEHARHQGAGLAHFLRFPARRTLVFQRPL